MEILLRISYLQCDRYAGAAQLNPMSYEIKFDEASSQHFIELKKTSPFVQVLFKRHLEEEEVIQLGAWMVLLLTPEKSLNPICFDYLENAAVKSEGLVRFGACLLESGDDIASWSQGASLGAGGPVTVIVLDGKILWSIEGNFELEKIQEAAGEFLYDYMLAAHKARGGTLPVPWFSPEWAMYVAYLAMAYFHFMIFTLEEWKYGQIGILLLCPLGVWLDFSISARDWELDGKERLILLVKRSIVALILNAPMLVSFYKQWL
jgi:hypothetical protein